MAILNEICKLYPRANSACSCLRARRRRLILLPTLLQLTTVARHLCHLTCVRFRVSDVYLVGHQLPYRKNREDCNHPRILKILKLVKLFLGAGK